MDSRFQAKEQNTARYTAVIKDETGAAVSVVSIVTLTLTLYDKDTETILNSRNGQNVLNLNGVTVDINGALVWILEPGDNAIVNDAKAYEDHVALFAFTYGVGGAKAGTWEVLLTVSNSQIVV